MYYHHRKSATTTDAPMAQPILPPREKSDFVSSSDGLFVVVWTGRGAYLS